MKVLNQDFQEEQTALSSLHAEIINKIEGQKKKISQGNRMMQGIRDIEDHDAWMIASDGVEMRKKAEHEIAALNQLRKAPYEARFDLAIEEKKKTKEYLIYLGRQYHECDDGRIIINWADDSTAQKRMLLNAYQDSVNQFKSDQYSYYVRLRRQIIIQNGVLESVKTAFDDRLQKRDEPTEEYIGDEFLRAVLESSREQASMRNIISTIQKKQNEIIRQPVSQSILVQGCAGSGKTQMLFHRLAYFRDGGKQVNWNNVRIISPNTMMRRQFRPLAKDLAIDDVKNDTLEDFYFSILREQRIISKRLYVVSSEQMLPSEYLIDVYSEQFTKDILTEVKARISADVSAATEYAMRKGLIKDIGRYKEIPLHSKIGMLRSIPRGKSDSELNVRLEEEQQNYEKAKTEYDELQQNLPELRNRLNSIDEWLASHGGEQWTRLEELLAQYVAVQKTIDDIERDFQQRRKAVQRELDALEEYNRTAQYKISTDHFKDQLKAYSPCGTIYDEYIDRVEYNELTLGVIKAEFQQIADRPDTDPVTFMEHIKEMSKILLEQRKNLAREIQRAESYQGRLTAFEKEIERLQIAVRKAEGSEMVKTFQENLNDYVTKLYREIVGPRIEELQKKYHVTNRTSTMRIAYRRDFYFMLYIFLLVFGAVERKSDRLFFLDEGQNISRGDYNLLFMLYPNAKWNIFGDLNRNLVSAAGVREWEFLPSDIKQFSMDENYRNPIQVTKMVNEAVGISMSPLGLPDGSVRTATVPMLTGIIQRTVGQGKSLAMIVASEGALRLMEAENPELRDKCKMVSDESPLCPKNCVPVYTVKSAHGMEFRNVIAFTRGMDRNMEYVAFTRTLQNLYIVR